MTSFAFSCVVDNVPALLAQAFLWVNCLKRLRGVNPRDIFVHVLDLDDTEFLQWLSEEGVNIVHIERFDPRNPYCNKIQQLNIFVGTHHDQIVFMDCDTAWIGDASMPIGSPVSACIVDVANPPERILTNIFAASGLGIPKWTRVTFGTGGGYEFTDITTAMAGCTFVTAHSYRALRAPGGVGRTGVSTGSNFSNHLPRTSIR
jgi:hypothetical protein